MSEGIRPGAVLVVDDDAAIRRSLERGLRLGGFRVRTAGSGPEALAAIRDTPPDVLVLDVSMPGMSGIEVCIRLRGDGQDLPVLMLSALDEAADRIAGLQAGGDDYLVKPFALQELVLRLHPAAPQAAGGSRHAPGGGPRDRPGGPYRAPGRPPLELTRREFELLEVLARNAGLVLTRDQLLDRVWGYDFDVRTDAVDTFVSYLRRKLEAHGGRRLVHTVRGVGFVLREEP
ncbi:response regulator transcription factor [Streptomyces sp. T1317-0309]|nr:response regulator transcription factor [Streptomyces sp. T1317-0309]